MDQASPNALVPESPPASAEVDALRRMKRENLIAFVIVSSQSVADDIREVRAVHRDAEDAFQYFEIVVVASMPSAEWREQLRDLGLEVRNLRIVMVDAAMGYEELSTAALRFAIGDLIVSLHPGEIGTGDIERMLQLCASGRWDLIKTFPANRARPISERLTASLIRWSMRLAMGRDIQTFQAHAYAMNRTALTRLQTIGGATRFFRLFDLSGLVSEGRMELDAPLRLSVLGSFGESCKSLRCLFRRRQAVWCNG